MELERLHNEGKIDRNKLNELNETLKNPAVSEAEAQAAIDHFNESGDVSLDDIMRGISTLNDPVSVVVKIMPVSYSQDHLFPSTKYILVNVAINLFMNLDSYG
jgi:hypothetical protein